MRNKLYYYRNKDEFNKFYNESQNRILPFEFVETKKIIEDESDNIIDITNMVAYTDTNQANIYSAIINLKDLDDRNQIIINKDWYEKALYFFPTVFDEALPLFDIEISNEISLKSFERTFFYYNDVQYDDLLQYAQQNKIIVTNFALLQKYTNCDNEILLDITSTIASIKGSPQLIYLLEQYFASSKDNIKVIINYNKLDEVKETLRLTFKSYQNISELYHEITNISPEFEKEDSPIKIVDLNENEINNLFDNINNKLIGHMDFKSKLISQLKNFLVLNKIGERKIFSIFLLGKPGLGKTEIGKIISKTLNPDSKIIKINFGNYSSQDALNSLIGSPAGYIGCEGGELSKKVNSNKVGVIICDEFEKADSEIKNFFLELLEDGRFTDSMSREYDINGYIIVFTSNIQNENEFKNKISPEFESRVNLICEFMPLTLAEKKEYVNFQIGCCIEKMKKEGLKIKFKPEDIIISYNDTDDLREIKNRILNKISEFV
ncbi:MAG: ATP-dependent Clp protease ATP-binding subunit [Bacilli bacterium]|nr:ATP-dependent Clp protease ATP-binding subunit [Bacilli bacterium]